jgi:hypothetical protein
MNEIVYNMLMLEPLAPVGHKDVNEFYLRMFKDLELTYVTFDDYLKIPDYVKFIPIKRKRIIKFKSKIFYRYYNYRILASMFRNVDYCKYDRIFFVSYETVSISIFFFLHKKIKKILYGKIFLMNHNNVDELERSKIKSFFFRRIPADFTFICYEQYIASFLQISFQKRTSVIRHNINSYGSNYTIDGVLQKKISAVWNNKIRLLIPSSIYITKKEISEIDQFISDKGLDDILGVVAKGCFDNCKNICIIDGYWSDSLYSFLFANSDIILIPYPESYKFRVSGIFFDSISYGKPVIFKDVLFFRNLLVAPGFAYNDMSGLLKILVGLSKISIKSLVGNIEFLKSHYSDSNILNDIKVTFNINV